MLLVAALHVFGQKVGFSNELVIVRIDVVDVQPAQLGAFEVLRKFEGRARNALLKSSAYSSTIRVRDCVKTLISYFWKLTATFTCQRQESPKWFACLRVGSPCR